MVLGSSSLLEEHHRRGPPVAEQQGDPGAGLLLQRRGDEREDRSDPRPSGDRDVVAGCVGLDRAGEVPQRGHDVDDVARGKLVDQPG
jgi:hypothetical protein